MGCLKVIAILKFRSDVAVGRIVIKPKEEFVGAETFGDGPKPAAKSPPKRKFEFAESNSQGSQFLFRTAADRLRPALEATVGVVERPNG